MSVFRKFRRADLLILLGTTSEGNYVVCNSHENADGVQSFNDVYVIEKATFEATYIEDEATAAAIAATQVHQ